MAIIHTIATRNPIEALAIRETTSSPLAAKTATRTAAANPLTAVAISSHMWCLEPPTFRAPDEFLRKEP
jgi:hypothetical protein